MERVDWEFEEVEPDIAGVLVGEHPQKAYEEEKKGGFINKDE